MTHEATAAPIRFVGYVNLPLLKQIHIGLYTFALLLMWALHHAGRDRVIHSFNLSVPPGVFVWLAAKMSRSKQSANICDINVPGSTVPNTALHRADYAMHRWLLPRIDAPFVASHAIAADFLPGRVACVINGGVTQRVLDFFADAAPPPGPPFVATFAGTLWDANGIRLILDAMRSVPADVHLQIAGDGPLRALVEERAAQDPRITYCGPVSHDEVLSLYKQSHLLLNIRVTETVDTRYFFPSKTFECLASGVPVLSTGLRFANEISRYVIHVKDETAASLAEAITTLSRTPRPTIGDKARAYARDHLTWDMQAKKMRSFWAQS